MRHDLHNNISPTNALSHSSITSNTTTVGVIIDRQGFGALEFLIKSATVTDGTFTPLIEDGNVSNLSDAAAVTDDNLLGTEATAAFTASQNNTVKRIGYAGIKRYVRLSMVSTGVTSGGAFSATAIKANADLEPTA